MPAETDAAAPPARRTGDAIAIPGSYQHRALHEGGAVQRFWHLNKQLTIDRYLPPAPGELALDVGCGSGVIADFLASRGASVIGIDASPEAVAFAQRTFRRENLSFRLGLADERIEAPPADKVYCLEVLEHLPAEQAAAVLRRFREALAPGGRIYVTTPNHHSAWPLIERVMDALALAPRMEGDQHVAHYTPRSLRRLCEGAGFAVERVATTCLLAPWLALFSRRLALRVNAMETGGPLGCIVVCVARKERP